MAIDAKISFMRQLSAGMGDVLTVEQMGKLNTCAMELLDHFDMTELKMQDAGDDDLLNCYLQALKVEGRSEKTIIRYEYIIKRMMDWVKVPTRRITVHHLRNYIAAEQDRGIKDSTLQGTRQVFTAYFNWLQREALIEKNPTANLGSIKVAKRDKKCYTEAELARLNMACENKRDMAILHFLSSTGCRISEMTGLNREDVDLKSLECVVHGKGNKDRVVFLSEVAGMMIKEYLEERKDKDPALFIGRKHERLAPDGVRCMLKALAKRAKVEHVHPHKFRRTRATELARRGMGIHEIARILGHERIDTTNLYLVMNKEEIKAEYRRYT